MAENMLNTRTGGRWLTGLALLICQLSLSALLASCAEDEGIIFSDHARVQLGTDAGGGFDDVSYTFVWSAASVTRDTVYLPIRVLGGPGTTDRQLALEQVQEQDVEYVRDRLNYVVDSVVTDRTDQAVPGRHYVDFASPECQALLTVPAGQVQGRVGIIVLRDPGLATASVRLRVRIKETDDFWMGESRYVERTVVISDMLEQPAAWTSQSWNSFYQSYGKYSRRKHLFMVEVVGGPVDDEWFQRAEDGSFRNYWRMKFIEALEAYNADPANIAAGLAPMREEADNVNSALITFPSGLN